MCHNEKKYIILCPSFIIRNRYAYLKQNHVSGLYVTDVINYERNKKNIFFLLSNCCKKKNLSNYNL